MPRRAPGVALRVLAAALVTTLGLTLGLTACDDDTPTRSTPPTPASTSLSDFATDDVTVTRGDFCSRVAPAEVEHALGGPATDADTYGNGDRAKLSSGVTDVAHEFGCTWKAADGTHARAWVFAPPVTQKRATSLRQAALDRKGCSEAKDAPAFGSPSVAVRCGGTITFQGLFGDAWLACSLDSTDIVRVGRWCVTALQAAG